MTFRRLAPLPTTILLLAAGCGGEYAHLPKPRPSADDEEAAPASPVAATSPSPKAETKGLQVNVTAPDKPTASVSHPGVTKVPARQDVSTAADVPKIPLASVPAHDPSQGTAAEVESRQRVINQLTRVAKALETYRERNGAYPSRCMGPQNNLSWRVALLPDLGYRELYLKFRLNEAWDSPHNRSLLREIPEEYKSAGADSDKTQLLYIQGMTGSAPDHEGLSEERCSDGLSNTVVLVEGAADLATPWSAPQDYVFEKVAAQQDLFELRQDCCYVVMGGSIGPRRLEANISDDQLIALFTPAGGEAVRYDDASRAPTPELNAMLLAELQVTPVRRFLTADHSPSPKAIEPLQLASSAREGSTTRATVVEHPEPPPARLPVPSDAMLASVTQQVREIYGGDYLAAKTKAEKRSFAKRIFDDAQKMAADPHGMLVLYRTARDIAARSGDVPLALAAVDALAAMFEMDPVPMKAASIEQAAAALGSESEAAVLIEQALRVAQQAMAADDFHSAKQLYESAEKVARRTNQLEVLSRIKICSDDLVQMQAAHRQISNQLHKVLRDPNDPVANTAVGRYVAFTKRDWQRGWSFLARGSDAELRGLAERELQLPALAEEQVQLGDQLWDWAQQCGNRLEARNARGRAVHWYRLAKAGIPESLLRARIEKRIADFSKSATEVDRPQLD